MRDDCLVGRARRSGQVEPEAPWEGMGETGERGRAAELGQMSPEHSSSEKNTDVKRPGYGSFAVLGPMEQRRAACFR